MLLVAEALGQSGTAQVVDLYPDSQFQPNYAIYEHGKPTKLVLFNYASDATGGADYQFNFTVAGGKVPGSVAVKYLLAPTVTSKANITWAGQVSRLMLRSRYTLTTLNQTLGGDFASDGRLAGALNVSTVACDTAANACLIPVPAPAVALVFLDSTDGAINDGAAGEGAQTFATTTKHTRTRAGATHTAVDARVLATSNGMSAKDRKMSSTSKNQKKNGARGAGVPCAAALFAALAGAVIVLGL
jgi:hypothetical protein